MSNRVISGVKLLVDEASFQLVRTNPKLTGNIKITINESGNLWLNTIPANQELSKDSYSRFPIDTTQSLATNLFHFLNEGSTPNEILFDLSEKVTSTRTSKDFKDQFDFSHYFSGVKYLASKKYSERMSYFAPLYLKKEIPNYFIVLKLEDPLNFPVDQMKALYDTGQDRTSYLIDLFKKASIIKTFDLSPSSKPGKYIRDYIASANFPISPLTVNYEENGFTTWNGIVINEGIFGSRGELIHELYADSHPLKFFEEKITNGFSRNGIIFPNILNLEFIFNDDTSSKYDLNRYLGVYVNQVELSKLDIDLEYAYANRGNWENTPHFRKQFLESDEVYLSQENENGVIVPYINAEVNVSEFSDIFTDSSSLFINYLTDKNGKMYMPKTDDPYTIDYGPVKDCDITSAISGSGLLVTVKCTAHGYLTGDVIKIESSITGYSGEHLITRINSNYFSYTISGSAPLGVTTGTASKELRSGRLRLANKKIDLGSFFGHAQETFLQDTGFVSSLPGYSHSVITINSALANYDEIRIYHPHGTRTDSAGKYDLFTSTVNYSLIPDPTNFYAYNDYDGVLGYDEFYFNGGVYPSEIAQALAGAINSIRTLSFTAYAYDDRVFIKLNNAGDFDSSYSITFTSQAGDYSSVTIDTYTSANLIGKQVYFKGGSKYTGNRLIIDSGHLDKISQNLNTILVKTNSGWSKIKKVSNYIDNITEKNLTTTELQVSAKTSYSEKIAIVLDELETPTITYTHFLMKKIFRPSFGLVSFFSIKDLDFDFYSSTYTNYPQIDLYQNYYVPADTYLLSSKYTYEVKGTGVIKLGSTQYTAPATITSLPSGYSKYSIVSGNPIVTYRTRLLNSSQSTYAAIKDENSELLKFAGFSILKDPALLTQPTYDDYWNYRGKYINGLTQTEYDYYKENDSLDFALRSKIIPYITKWGIKNGLDSRSNPYRLNTEIVFGRNNFSPSHISLSQDPLGFTHEWFYIESDFGYNRDESLVSQNTTYFERRLDENLLLTDKDYFLNYFTYIPTTFSGKEVGSAQIRYANLYKNVAGQYEAFFKGFKMVFKDVIDSNVIGVDGKPISKDNTSRFEGYRFSCILRPIQEDINGDAPPIKFKFIEQPDEGFKFIVLIIELSIGSIDSIDDYWKTVSPHSINQVSTSNFLNDTLIPSGTAPFDTINGDYRIEFNSNNVSNLTHAILYSLHHKKYFYKQDRFSNVRMASKLKLGQLNTGSLPLLSDPNIPNYPFNLSDDIVFPTQQTLIMMRDTNYSLDLFLDSVNGVLPNRLNIIDYAVQDSAHYTNIESSIYGGITNGLRAFGYFPNAANDYQLVAIPTLSYYRTNYKFKVMGGGEGYFEKLFQKLSFANFKKYVNELHPVIEYYTTTNGGHTTQTAENYYLEILDPDTIVKTSQLIVNDTQSIPVQYSGSQISGYDYEVASLSRPYETIRYKGEYEPVIRDISAYQSQYAFSRNLIDSIKLNNLSFNSSLLSSMTLNNFNHIKVSESKILELESDDIYSPVYPAIDEVAIGQSDYFLLKGNWDWGFHLKYSTKSEKLPVAGSLRVEEDESFLAKLVTLPEYIELENFDIDSTVPSHYLVLGENDSLDNVNTDLIELAIKETPTTIDGIINVNNLLTRYFIEDGLSTKFNEFLVNSNEYIGNFNSIEDYVKEYIRLNILPLYTIEANEFYYKKNAAATSANDNSNVNPNIIEFIALNDVQRFAQGYTILKSVQINKKDRLILKFTYAKNVSSGISISPKIKIKFI